MRFKRYFLPATSIEEKRQKSWRNWDLRSDSTALPLCMGCAMAPETAVKTCCFHAFLIEQKQYQSGDQFAITSAKPEVRTYHLFLIQLRAPTPEKPPVPQHPPTENAGPSPPGQHHRRQGMLRQEQAVARSPGPSCRRMVRSAINRDLYFVLLKGKTLTSIN